jgi:hypothetical protein
MNPSEVWIGELSPHPHLTLINISENGAVLYSHLILASSPHQNSMTSHNNTI